MSDELRLRLRGPGGEPIDLQRTFLSHGVADLPPLAVDGDGRSLTATLALPRGRPRTVTVRPGAPGTAEITASGRAPTAAQADAIAAAVRHILRFDEDLSAFYGNVSDDPELSWVAQGAGRMIRSQTVFEDVVKTICTTNCAWSATERMVAALVTNLGEPAASGVGRAFPTAASMAQADDAFYREVVRAGYRGNSLRDLARTVAAGELDLECLDASHPAALDDGEVERRLLAIHGVGPYAAAHVMMMLGRYSRLILDSWTRPTYARLVGRARVADATIVKRFRRYGEYAGLAFWLFLTRDWVD